MVKFKIGDKVKVVNTNGFGTHIKIGDVGEISHIYQLNEKAFYEVRIGNSSQSIFKEMVHNIELIVYETEETEEVEIIDDEGNSQFKISEGECYKSYDSVVFFKNGILTVRDIKSSKEVEVDTFYLTKEKVSDFTGVFSYYMQNGDIYSINSGKTYNAKDGSSISTDDLIGDWIRI